MKRPSAGPAAVCFRAVVTVILVLGAGACNDGVNESQSIELQFVRPVVDPGHPFSVAGERTVTGVTVRLPDNSSLTPQNDGTVRFSWPAGNALSVAVLEGSGDTHVYLDIPATSTTLRLAPAAVSDSRPIAVTAITTVVISSAWSPSGIGERSEGWVVTRPAGNQRIDPQLETIEDRYLRAGFETGTQDNQCVCQGGTAPDCSDGTIVCADDDTFSSRVSAATVFTVPGPNRIGFAERIVEYETATFRELGWLFLNDQFDPGFAGPVTVVAGPVILPDDELCGGDGRLRIVAEELGRGFVLPSEQGLALWLDLVAPDGFRLPLLIGDRFRGADVLNTSRGQQVSFGFPYPLTGALAGHRYHVRGRAAKTLTSERLELTVAITAQRWQDSAESLCDVTLDFADPVFSLLTPTAPTTTPTTLEWVSDQPGLTLIRLDGEHTTYIWLGAPRNRIDLGADLSTWVGPVSPLTTITWSIWPDLPAGVPDADLVSRIDEPQRIDITLPLATEQESAAESTASTGNP